MTIFAFRFAHYIIVRKSKSSTPNSATLRNEFSLKTRNTLLAQDDTLKGLLREPRTNGRPQVAPTDEIKIFCFIAYGSSFLTVTTLDRRQLVAQQVAWTHGPYYFVRTKSIYLTFRPRSFATPRPSVSFSSEAKNLEGRGLLEDDTGGETKSNFSC